MNNLCRAHPISQLLCAVKEPPLDEIFEEMKKKKERKIKKKLPSEMFCEKKSFFLLSTESHTLFYVSQNVGKRNVLGWKNNCCFTFPSDLFKTFLMFTFLISFHLEVFRIILRAQRVFAEDERSILIMILLLASETSHPKKSWEIILGVF
jgi:hypothetical protein